MNSKMIGPIFRAMSLDNRWHEGQFVILDDCAYIVNDGHFVRVYPNSMAYFSGVLDRKGNKIFEGQSVQDTKTNRFYTVLLGYCKEHHFTGFYCASPDRTIPLNGEYGTENNSAIEILPDAV